MVEIRNEYMQRDYDAIMAANPVLELYSSETEVFEEVYYPVSVLEISMEEETFEDLEAVQHHIMEALIRFPLQGQDIPTQIAHAFGLSPQYVSKILKLFRGYGYIDSDYKITAFGKESYNANMEIHRVHTKQLFYMDTLNGNILKLSYNFDKHVIKRASEVKKWAVIIPDFPENRSKTSLSDYMTNHDGDDFIKHNRSVLHANIREVNDIKCVDRQFIKGYLISNDEISIPLFYTKYYDLTKKPNERTGWKPLVVGGREDYDKLQLNESIYIAGSLYKTQTNEVINRIKERDQKREEKRRQREEEYEDEDDFENGFGDFENNEDDFWDED